jgi:hypothetical protein
VGAVAEPNAPPHADKQIRAQCLRPILQGPLNPTPLATRAQGDQETTKKQLRKESY